MSEVQEVLTEQLKISREKEKAARAKVEEIEECLARLLSPYQVGDRVWTERTHWQREPFARVGRSVQVRELWEVTNLVYEGWTEQKYCIMAKKVRKDGKLMDRRSVEIGTDYKPITAKQYPCHRKPKEQWCDSNGHGGFMGHTCT